LMDKHRKGGQRAVKCKRHVVRVLVGGGGGRARVRKAGAAVRGTAAPWARTGELVKKHMRLCFSLPCPITLSLGSAIPTALLQC
jgi:hypothetical protein